MILSTSRHITEGAVDLVDVTWDDANAQLKITSDHLDKDPYAVVIYVPPGFEYRSVSARAKSGVEHVTPSALKITFPNTYGKKMIWRILFHRSA